MLVTERIILIELLQYSCDCTPLKCKFRIDLQIWGVSTDIGTEWQLLWFAWYSRTALDSEVVSLLKSVFAWTLMIWIVGPPYWILIHDVDYSLEANSAFWHRYEEYRILRTGRLDEAENGTPARYRVELHRWYLIWGCISNLYFINLSKHIRKFENITFFKTRHLTVSPALVGSYTSERSHTP